jgi:hypothetical protein
VTLDDLIVLLRLEVADTTLSNQLWKSAPDGVVDGVNTHFRLQSAPVVQDSVYLTYGTNYRQQSSSGAWTIDPATGIITFNTAPVSGTKITADYNFLWFDDGSHTNFLKLGCRMLDVGGTDPTLVEDGLITALIKYSAYWGYHALATRYAALYPSSGGGVGQNVTDRVKNLLALADRAKKDGDDIRKMFYQRQGQRDLPTFKDINYNFDPVVPIR